MLGFFSLSLKKLPFIIQGFEVQKLWALNNASPMGLLCLGVTPILPAKYTLMKDISEKNAPISSSF